ncbi:MAG: hypothetical protein K9N06_12020 [Candidatus Cloacimonetes bacterium]|nr:hypothetical protein [Candidatus Cloacimonadota bacterium]
MIKFILIVFIFSINTAFLRAEETAEISTQDSLLFGVGIGLGWQFNTSMLHGNSYYCARNYRLGLIDDSNLYYTEFALLYGKAIHFNAKYRGYFSFACGISYVDMTFLGESTGYESYEKFHYSTWGLPFDINFTEGISPYFGIGANITCNFNSKRLFGSVFTILYIGDFQNKNNQPGKSSKSELPSIELPQEQSEKETGKKDLRHLCLDFNVPNYFYYTLLDQKSENETIKSYKFNCALSGQKEELVFPYTYKESSRQDISERYERMISYGIKGRKFLNDKSVFIDIGLIKYNVYGKDEISLKDFEESNYYAALSFGMRALVDHFYIGTQINAGYPLGNEDIYFKHISVVDLYKFFINIDLITIGVRL